jgi:hypothetical protein
VSTAAASPASTPLEQLLDDSIGKPLTLSVQRGGSLSSMQVQVSDRKHHGLSYRSSAMRWCTIFVPAGAVNLPIRGVYVANPGYSLAAAGVPRGALITAVNSQPVNNAADFRAQLALLADGDRAAMRFTTIDDPNGSQLRSVRIDRRWFPARACRRDDVAGLWPCEQLEAGPPPRAVTAGTTALPAVRDKLVAKLAPSLAHITFDMPFAIAGITERNYHGTGLIVDAARGLVVTDRNTVPVSLGDAPDVWWRAGDSRQGGPCTAAQPGGDLHDRS